MLFLYVQLLMNLVHKRATSQVRHFGHVVGGKCNIHNFRTGSCVCPRYL